MTIAVHISLGDSPQDILSTFNYRCFTLMASRYPDDHFIFIFDKPYDPALISSPNSTPVLLGPPLKNRLLRHYWYQFKLPRILARYQADWYINQDKMTCLKTEARQLMILEDLAFIDQRHAYPSSDRRYLRKYFPLFANKADGLLILNESLKDLLVKKLPSCHNKIFSAPSMIETHRSIIPEKIREEAAALTEEKSYFIFLATEYTRSQLVSTLKAFSIFKKWQLSNMQLVILSELSEQELPLQDLQTYKYRKEVKPAIQVDPALKQALLASAYAGIYVSAVDIPEAISLEALSAGLPLICTESPFQQARHGTAALYAAPTEKSIAEKMMRLYKEENERAALIRSAGEIGAAANPEQAVSRIRMVLLEEKDLTFAVQ